jgi:hypothetical protein
MANTATATTPDNMPCRTSPATPGFDESGSRTAIPAAAAAAAAKTAVTSARAAPRSASRPARRAIMTMSTVASTAMPALLAAPSAVMRSAGGNATDRRTEATATVIHPASVATAAYRFWPRANNVRECSA